MSPRTRPEVFALADHDQEYGSSCIQKTEMKDLALYRYFWLGSSGEMGLEYVLHMTGVLSSGFI